MHILLTFLDYFGVIVFAITGCLVAARKRGDIIAFWLLATVTAIGGGTLRDMILDHHPVVWVKDPVYLPLCAATACVMFFAAHWIHRRERWVLWADAIGLAVFAVIGTQVTMGTGASLPVCLLMGVTTATFGGVIRDVLSGEPTLILRKEVYVTAALAGSLSYWLMAKGDLEEELRVPLAVTIGFVIRALALRYRLTLPGYAWVRGKASRNRTG